MNKNTFFKNKNIRETEDVIFYRISKKELNTENLYLKGLDKNKTTLYVIEKNTNKNINSIMTLGNADLLIVDSEFKNCKSIVCERSINFINSVFSTENLEIQAPQMLAKSTRFGNVLGSTFDQKAISNNKINTKLSFDCGILFLINSYMDNVNVDINSLEKIFINNTGIFGKKLNINTKSIASKESSILYGKDFITIRTKEMENINIDTPKLTYNKNEIYLIKEFNISSEKLDLIIERQRLVNLLNNIKNECQHKLKRKK